MEIKNVIYRNKNKNSIDSKNKDISNTININDSNSNATEMKNIRINLDKKLIINRNHKNMSKVCSIL